MDPRGEDKEGTLSYPPPPKEIDDSFIKLYENHSLMLPSERYKEHLHMKKAERQWREDRDKVFRYRKRWNVLERKHPEGVLGVDGPMYADTKLYSERHEHLCAQADKRAVHAEGRFEHLAQQKA